MKRAKKANQTKALISGRGRRAPAWVRELERLELGVRGQCPSCDKWGTLQNGICLRAPTLSSTATRQPEGTVVHPLRTFASACTCLHVSASPCTSMHLETISVCMHVSA